MQPILDAYASAVWARDVDAFMRLYDANVRVFDAWGKWSYEGADAWRKTVEQWFGSLGEERVKVSFDDAFVTPGEGVSVLSATVTYAGIAADGTPLRSLQNRLTWALRQDDDWWRVLHEHTSVPVSIDESKAILRREDAQ